VTLVYHSDIAPKGDLADRWPDWAASAGRRVAAGRKLRIYGEDHRGMVLELIRDRLQNAEVASYVQKFASRSPNLLRAVVDAIAVSYQRGCRRELRGLGETAAKAFADIVAESGIDRKANGLNAKAWLTGPVIVSPHLDTRGRLALDIVTSDVLDVQRDGDYLAGVLWRSGGTWIELTEDAWHYYDASGELTKSVPHGAGMCPAVAFTAIDNTADFWCSAAHAGLADATLDVAYLLAFGLYVRQVSGTKLTVVRGNIENIGAGQSLGHPALPLVLSGTPGDVDVQVFDRIVPAKDHLEEIGALITMAISAEGLPPGSVQMVANNSDWGNLAIQVEGSRLGVLRDRQVPFCRAGELDIWPLAIEVLRSSTHRHARALPPGDEVRDALRVGYPDLSSPKETRERIEAMKAGLPYGLTSPADWLLAARPELTRAEAEEEMRENLRVYLDTIEPLVNRNLPRSAPTADGAQTIAQDQGREGGLASGETRRNDPPQNTSA